MLLLNSALVLIFVITGLCVFIKRAESKSCSSNEACSSTEACVNGVCADPCKDADCGGPNTQCEVFNHAPKCSCIPGYVRGVKGCIPGGSCSSNEECSSTEGCLNGVCADPCKDVNCGGPNTQCQVINHAPKCSCIPGYVRGEKGCIPGGSCSSNKECSSTEGCLNGVCADPCKDVNCGGPNTQCQVINHAPKCSCIPGYVRGEKGCIPGAESGTCSSNGECSSTEACLKGVCADPCKGVNCGGPNTRCIVIKHAPKCSCIPGYVRGEKGCVPGGAKLIQKKGKFLFIDKEVSWYYAVKDCVKRNMHLTIISSGQDNKDLKKYLDEQGTEFGVWLGAQYITRKVNWINEHAIAFYDWRLDDPFTISGCISTCKKEQERKWALFDCMSPTRYVCEQ